VPEGGLDLASRYLHLDPPHKEAAQDTGVNLTSPFNDRPGRQLLHRLRADVAIPPWHRAVHDFDREARPPKGSLVLGDRIQGEPVVINEVFDAVRRCYEMMHLQKRRDAITLAATDPHDRRGTTLGYLHMRRANRPAKRRDVPSRQ
jgi:hypothetical protein